MVRVQVSKTIDAPQDRIFSIITDFERLPSRLPDRYKSLQVLERAGNNTVTVKETIAYAGREVHQITRHEMEPGWRLRSEVIEGDTKGTVVEITLEPDAGRTRVSVDVDLKLGKLGSVLGVFARGRIKGGLERMMEQFGNAG